MPANRMKAAVGSTLKVIGSNSAMVSAGPSPGSTPIAVPSVVPTRHHIRFIGVTATAKPLSSWEKASMARTFLRTLRTLPEAEDALDRALDDAGADIDAEGLCEAEIGDQREGRADRRVAQDRLRAEAARHADEQDDRCDGEAGGADEQDVEHEAGRDPQQRNAVGGDVLLFLGAPAALERLDHQQDAEDRQAGGGDHRHDSRADLGVDRRDRNAQRLPEDDGGEHQHAGGDDDLAQRGAPPRRPAGSPEAPGHVTRARAL